MQGLELPAQFQASAGPAITLTQTAQFLPVVTFCIVLEAGGVRP